MENPVVRGSMVRLRADGLETEPRKRAIQRDFLVAQGRIELPTRGFSVRCSTN